MDAKNSNPNKITIKKVYPRAKKTAPVKKPVAKKPFTTYRDIGGKGKPNFLGMDSKVLPNSYFRNLKK
jgi:hypothetical protein